MLWSSCVKYEQSTPFTISDSLTATVTGYAYAQLDLSDGDAETAPSGTKIYIQIDNDEYIDNTEGSKIYTTTVGSDGKYTFTIPTTSEGVMFKIFADDFEYDQIQFDGSTTERTIFSLPEQYIEVTGTQKLIEDLNFNY